MDLLGRWDDLARDVRISIRSLRGTLGFAVITVSSLAVGLALAAVTVAAVNAYLIRALPYAAGERLYRVRYAPPGPWEPRGMTALDWRSVEDVVEFPITSSGETFYLSDGEYSESARGLRVGRGFIEGLGVRAALGRSLDGNDFAPADAERSALIGHALWRGRFGADPDVVGRLLRVDAEGSAGGSETLRIVGVLPPAFYFGRDSRETVDVLVPLTAPARTYMVRLRPGVPAALAEARITEAARQVASGLPADWTGVHLDSLHELYVRDLRPTLVGVTVACGLVLLIVCANVAVMMLLRMMRQQKERAVRAALGCGRWRLARMLLIDAVLVCAAGAISGVTLAAVALQALAPSIEAQLGRPAPGGASAIAVDTTVLLLLGATGLAMALAIALLPIAAAWSRPLLDALRGDGTAGGGSRSMRRARSALVVIEIAGTLVLLVACGLMVRSVVAMVQTDLGFESDRLARGRVVLRGSDYADAARFSRFYEAFTERLSAAIQAPVAFSNWPPFAEHPVHLVETDERAGQGVAAGSIAVGPGYFAALGIELRSGRDLDSTDTSDSAAVAVISETLARRLWPNRSPIGKYVREVEPTVGGEVAGPWRRVVAVAADVRQSYGDRELSDIYVPYARQGRFGAFYMRTDRSPSGLTPIIRRIAAEIDPHAMAGPARTVASQNQQLEATQFLTMTLTGVAAIAALLAVLGIYGVTAYAVRQRERETAIRMALGAAAGAVVRMFLQETALLVTAGLALGLLGAAAAASIVESQLYGVRRFDPLTLVVTCALLAAAGALAAWWPARRASRRSPALALKDG